MATKREHLLNLRRHDWSYMMSDDGQVYRRGAAAESGLITAEKNNPELAGMFKQYYDWWWGTTGGNPGLSQSGTGKHSGEPEPTFGVAME